MRAGWRYCNLQLPVRLYSSSLQADSRAVWELDRSTSAPEQRRGRMSHSGFRGFQNSLEFLFMTSCSSVDTESAYNPGLVLTDVCLHFWALFPIEVQCVCGAGTL